MLYLNNTNGPDKKMGVRYTRNSCFRSQLF